MAAQRDRIEWYYDTVPRASAAAREVGPFTLFVADQGWPYYARPRRGSDHTFRSAEVVAVLEEQQRLGVPRQIEWVHETTPTLLSAARAAGIGVLECPLLWLPGPVAAGPPPAEVTVSILSAEDAQLANSRGAVQAAFEGSDEVAPQPAADWLKDRLRAGLLRWAGAFERGAAVGGGSHSPRDDVSELMGIAVLPRARRRGVGAALTSALASDATQAGVTTVFLSAQDETVARVYERVGFTRIGTACIAQAG